MSKDQYSLIGLTLLLVLSEVLLIYGMCSFLGGHMR